METKSELAKAIISVMNEVAGIEKSLTVGSGNSSYKGVSDKDVKRIIGNAMAKHGLCILPLDINAKSQIDRWEEVDQYSKSVPKDMKTKQSVFVEVETKYLLLHTSGESQTIAGYGHGVDSQDKSAGKATTYALKNALLYTFMIPTGDIDDADKTHSDDHAIPKKSVAPTRIKEDTEAQRVANMQGVKVSEITLEEHKAVINSIPSAVGLGGYFNSLTNLEKANQDIIALLSARREELKVDTTKS
jgi:hypothetical protein